MADSGQRRPALVAAGAVMLLGALAYGLVGLEYEVGGIRRPGAGLFPLLTALLTGVASAGMVLEGLRRRPAGAPISVDGVDGAGAEDADGDVPAPEPRVRVLTVIGVLVGYLVGITWVGHLVTAAVVTTVGVRLLGGRSWWRAAAFGVGAAAATHLLFAELLGLPLPQGLYGPRW